MSWKPSSPFVTPLILLKPTYTKIQGSLEREYPDPEGQPLFFGSFKTYGGTDLKGSTSEKNGLYVVIDTCNIETHFRPDIKADCRIYCPINDATYEIINEPENIEMRSVYLKFKGRRIKGGA